MTAYSALSMRRRGSSTDGRKLPYCLGIFNFRFPRLGRQQPLAVTVALGHAGGALNER